MIRHPVTRTLSAVLRQQARTPPPRSLRLVVGQVVATPDSAHITIDVNGDGDTVTVPRLASVTGVAVGDAVYCIASSSIVIAIGTIK